MLLNIGPAHPAMHGIIRIVSELDGEQIESAEVEIGYLHRGFEKMAETVDYNGVIPYTDRLNYVSPLINNMGYCMSVEKLLGISVPERCHYVRVILSEISRHLGPPHLRGGDRHGVGGVHRLSLHDQGPRVSLGTHGEGHRGEADGQLLPCWRRQSRSARGFRRALCRGVQGDSQGHLRRSARAADAEPHLSWTA